MAANERLDELSTTDASNTPAGSDVVGSSLDNELRSIKANIARSAREESTATVSAASTLAVTILNKIVPVSGSAAGSTTISLPAAATAGAGFRFTAWKTDNVNNVVIDADGAETINGIADYTMSIQYQAAQFVTDGTSWVTINSSRDTFSNINTDSFVDGVDFTAGTSQSITLSGFPGDEANTQIFFDGVYQEKTTYSLASGVVTFDAVIPLGVSQVEAVYVQLADYLAAQGVSYNNGTSGLTGTNVQAAIDELLPKTDATSYGFYTTRNAAEPVTDVDISAGQCWDTTRASFMVGSAMTKQLDATWAAGTNAGMLDTGTVSFSEGYHIYVMISDQDGSVDYIASLAGTWAGVTKPTNYTKGQIIGYIARDSSAILPVRWKGSLCHYTTEPHLVVEDSSITSQTPETYDVYTAAADSLVNFTLHATNFTNGSDSFYVSFIDTSDTPSVLPLDATMQAYRVAAEFVESTSHPEIAQRMVPYLIDSDRELQIAVSEGSGSAVLQLYVRSFWMVDRLEATS